MRVILLLSLLLLPFQEKNKDQDVSKLKDELVKAHDNSDWTAVVEKLTELAKINNKEAFKVLKYYANKHVGKSEYLYWKVANAMASVTSKAALDELADYIISLKKWSIAKDLMFLLQANSSFNVIRVLRKVMKEGTEDLKLMAIDRLTVTGDKDVVFDLVKLLEKQTRDDAVKQAILKALRDLTEKNAGNSAKDWKKWLEENKNFNVVKQKQINVGPKTGTVMDEIDIPRKVPTDRLKKLPKDAILVLTSGKCRCGKEHNYDRIEEILRKMTIPHTVITKADLENAGPNFFKGKIALLSNCTRWKMHCVCKTCKLGAIINDQGVRAYKCTGCDKHLPYEHRLSKAAVTKIAQFVVDGGYLFAEDWNLEEIIIPGFPGVIDNMRDLNGNPIYSPGETVPIKPFWGSTAHPYLQKMFFKPIGEKGKIL